MPYYKCAKCHHEFEYIPIRNEKIKCDWCGAKKPIMLEEQTSLEKMCKNIDKVIEIIEKNNAKI